MITKLISKTLNLPIITEVTDNKFSMFDDGSAEIEICEYFYGLVRAIKPSWLLETGTYKGILSSYIGLALKENGFGILETIEYEKKHLDLAKERWIALGIQDYIVEFFQDCRTFVPKHNYRLIICDTEPYLRWDEVVRYYSFLDEGGYIFVHDTPRNLTQDNVNPDHPDFKSWPFGELPQQIKDWLKSGELIKFHLGSARGLLGLYKPHPDDYQI